MLLPIRYGKDGLPLGRLVWSILIAGARSKSLTGTSGMIAVSGIELIRGLEAGGRITLLFVQPGGNLGAGAEPVVDFPGIDAAPEPVMGRPVTRLSMQRRLAVAATKGDDGVALVLTVGAQVGAELLAQPAHQLHVLERCSEAVEIKERAPPIDHPPESPHEHLTVAGVVGIDADESDLPSSRA